MQMINIAICEDNKIDRTLLVEIVRHLIEAKGSQATISEFASGEELTEKFKEEKFDLVFLDIMMNNMNGIEAGKIIHSLDAKAEIVYCTSSSDFAIEAHEVHAMGYLLKPYDPFRIGAIVDYYLQKYPEQNQKYISVKSKWKTYNIFYKDIVCVESENKVVNFYTLTQGTIKVYGKLDEFETQLDDNIFLRCHQSYLVNLRHVVGCTGTDFITLNQQFVPIRKSGRKAIIERYNEYELQERQKNIMNIEENLSALANAGQSIPKIG